MKILTSEQTRSVERSAMRMGMSGERLMENAGAAATRVIKEKFEVNGLKAVVVVGQGNNGGDGYVVARKLKEYGTNVTVILAMGPSVTADSTSMFNRARQAQVAFLNYYDDEVLCAKLIESSDIIVDAIFGIGFHGAPDRDACEIIGKINDSSAKKISLDIPSGLTCDSGEVKAPAVCADLTISFIGYKPCQFLFPSSNYCGKTVAVSIGIDEQLITEGYAEIIDNKKSIGLLSDIPLAAHKGTKGMVVIFGGSYGMVGAPVLSAKAAYRSGAGIVRVCLPDNVYPIAATMLPEAIFSPASHNEGFLTSDSVKADIIKGAKAVLVGPGMGLNADTVAAVAKIVALSKVPTVIDADGLNALAEDPEILKSKQADVIITPHPGEMSRLCGKSVAEIQNNRIAVASNYAVENKVITVLKGAYTVIALPSGRVFINTTGNAGMATAGSGDMLAGMISAFLANGTDPVSATIAAVNLHGAVGDMTAEQLGIRGITTSDMIQRLPFLLNQADK